MKNESIPRVLIFSLVIGAIVLLGVATLLFIGRNA